MDSVAFLVKRPNIGHSTPDASFTSVTSVSAFLVKKPVVQHASVAQSLSSVVSVPAFLVKKPTVGRANATIPQSTTISQAAFLVPKLGIKLWQPLENSFQIITVKAPVLITLQPTVPVRQGDILFSGNVDIDYGDLRRDPTLETAVQISLFTDRRAHNDDELPNFTRDLRGWWADSTLGSRLWLLSRSKNVETVRDQAKFYCLEALEWMVTDGLCRKVLVDVSRYDTYSILISIQIINTEKTIFQFQYNWKLMLLEST